MSFDSEDRPRKFYTILDDNFLPRIVYPPALEKIKAGEHIPDDSRDRRIAREVFELLNSRPKIDDDEVNKLLIENHINTLKIREVVEIQEVPEGKDYYAEVIVPGGEEPVHISFTSSGDYGNVPSAAIIPQHPGKKLFKLIIKVTGNNVRFSLNNKKFQRKAITTLATDATLTYEAKVGVFESITLTATSGATPTVFLYGFY